MVVGVGVWLELENSTACFSQCSFLFGHLFGWTVFDFFDLIRVWMFFVWLWIGLGFSFCWILVCWLLLCVGVGVLMFFDGEFDPGSGRTLAACLTHASRTERPSFFVGVLEWRTGE